MDGLDVVVGGHTNTFLWTEDARPSRQGRLEEGREVGRYPTMVTQKGTGRKVLVVQVRKKVIQQQQQQHCPR